MGKIFGKRRKGASLTQTRYKMIKRESDLVGSRLFGAIPKGHTREFYCLDEHTWVWLEEWKEGTATQRRMVRYEVLADKVIKNIDGVYKKVGETELANLRQAIHIYYMEVMRNIYKVDPYTGQALL